VNLRGVDVDRSTNQAAQTQVRMRKRRRVRRRRGRRRAWAAVGALGFVALLDGAWAANGAVRDLLQVRHQLEAAAEDIVEGRLEDAQERFGLARSFADQAAGLTAHPAAALADLLPPFRGDVDAVQIMAAAVDRGADAGTELVRGARAAGWDGSGLPGLDAGGHVPLAPFEAAAPHLREAADHMRAAERTLSPIDASSLIGPVADAARDVRTAIGERAGTAEAAAGLAEMVPAFLGGDEPRRYFLALQNLSAPRGTGGFLGLYGILEADRGRLQLTELAHVQTLGRVPPIEATEDVVRRYGRFGGTTHFIAANYSPDFPTTAEVILEMGEAAGEEALDGVIAADPVWMGDALRALGPVETPAWPEPITANNVSTTLHRDTFLVGSKESNRAQEAIGRALWQAFLDRPLPLPGLAQAMARGVREGHLQVYSGHPEEQEVLGRLEATGDVRLGEHPLFVVWQDATGNRAGFFARKETRHRVVLHANGSAEVRTMVTLRNEAPGTPPSVLLGDGTTGDPVGYFAAYVNVYLPEEAEQIRSQVSTGFRLGLVEEEFGRPVVVELLGAEAGGSASMEVSYVVPDAMRRLGDTAEYRLGFLPQPSLRPGLVEMEIVPPQGLDVVDAAPGMRVMERSVRFRGAPVVARSLWVRLS
jgi:hypothetical protein